jgi:hypothetical protein
MCHSVFFSRLCGNNAPHPTVLSLPASACVSGAASGFSLPHQSISRRSSLRIELPYGCFPLFWPRMTWIRPNRFTCARVAPSCLLKGRDYMLRGL